MTDQRNLTAVIISYRKKRINHRLLFGTPKRFVRRGWRRQLAVFEPGQIFAYERWTANQYGTQDWQTFICKATEPNSEVTEIPGVQPGALLLLNANGATACKRLRPFLSLLEDRYALTLETLSEAYWLNFSNAISTGTMHDFIRDRHARY